MDDEIRTLLQRLCRPHASGGHVVERSAILAAGGDYEAVIAWIEAHAGIAEDAASTGPRRGLHGTRRDEVRSSFGSAPARFVLPPDVLS